MRSKRRKVRAAKEVEAKEAKEVEAKQCQVDLVLVALFYVENKFIADAISDKSLKENKFHPHLCNVTSFIRSRGGDISQWVGERPLSKCYSNKWFGAGLENKKSVMAQTARTGLESVYGPLHREDMDTACSNGCDALTQISSCLTLDSDSGEEKLSEKQVADLLQYLILRDKEINYSSLASLAKTVLSLIGWGNGYKLFVAPDGYSYQLIQSWTRMQEVDVPRPFSESLIWPSLTGVKNAILPARYWVIGYSGPHDTNEFYPNLVLDLSRNGQFADSFLRDLRYLGPDNENTRAATNILSSQVDQQKSKSFPSVLILVAVVAAKESLCYVLKNGKWSFITYSLDGKLRLNKLSGLPALSQAIQADGQLFFYADPRDGQYGSVEYINQARDFDETTLATQVYVNYPTCSEQ